MLYILQVSGQAKCGLNVYNKPPSGQAKSGLNVYNKATIWTGKKWSLYQGGRYIEAQSH